MSDTRGRVLVLDDEAVMCDLLETGLGERGFEVMSRTSPRDALRCLSTESFDVLVTDLRMRELDGVEMCREALALRPGLPVIVITAFGSLDTAVAAIRAGAYDFITKPFEIEVVAIAVERAVQARRLREQVRRLREQVARGQQFEGLIGQSHAMQRVFEILERVSRSDASVLVTGESGTGKELAARALHTQSRRCEGPFVAVNCAAVPEPLLESELFGHARGAFTDARTQRTGLFQQATGGTLFLDEIGEMPLGMQVKLLRALQERKVRPVGSDDEVSFDARVVTATNQDLESAVDSGRFRQDLYFRLNVIQIELPPLRSRGNDVLLIAQHFIDRSAEAAEKGVTGLSSSAAEKLLAYSWPGNVRELQNCLERAVVLTRFDNITVDDLPEKVREHHPSHIVVASDDLGALIPLSEMEKRYILKVLEATGGQRTTAAQILGLDRKTLYRKLERWQSQTR
jgi:two-component system response regulator HydG